MEHVFIGLGSNLGDREKYLRMALIELAHINQSGVLKKSSIYETEPVGIKEQPRFLNMVIEMESSLAPKELLHMLKDVERKIGRTKSERWGPREIDLDLLYYGNEIYNDDELQLPHPGITNRRFVLVPLKEICGNYLDPLHNMSIEELLHHCSDTNSVRKTVLSINTKNTGVNSATAF